MTHNYLTLFFIAIFPLWLAAQKEIYIPLEWQQPGGLEYSFDRSAESENFIVFWGPLAGTDPMQAPPEIAFNPQSILATAEELYKFYIDTIQFVNDDAGLISQYKIILVMLHTWTGLEGWAFGGNYDATVGAMWMHPHAASSGPTLAHEFTHTLQNYTWMMNPGHGFINNSYVGFFWEAHAEFMALQRYPSVALEFDMARWLNTNHFHWSSTRHHYQAFIFLQFIKEEDGIGMINRMWSESIIGEHPLETYKRLKNITQEELNDLFATYAMRNVTWDYEIGDLLRERASTLPDVFVAHETIIPAAVDTSKGWYKIQNHLAPQDYGHNIIRLYPDSANECGRRIVYINLRTYNIWPDDEKAGLRFGFVAVDQSGQPRYSDVFDATGTDFWGTNSEYSFELEQDEYELYLVVSGAPVNHHNYDWEIGFPKIYRYPYEFKLKNAKPEGYQPGFNNPPVGIAGAPHSNGGGFVALTANVAPSAYVGPNAMVLDQALVIDNARIEDFAVIRHAAIVSESAIVKDMAIVGESSHIYGNAVISGQAHVYGDSEVHDSAHVTGNAQIFFTKVYEHALLKDNTFAWGANLHGDIILGGDAEFFRECSDGTYLQFESAYDRNCDGLDDHPANVSFITTFLQPDMTNRFSLVCDTLLQNELNEWFWNMCEGDTFYFDGHALTSEGPHEFIYLAASGADSIVTITIEFMPILEPILFGEFCVGDTVWFEGYPITEIGTYDLFIETFGPCGILIHVNTQPILIDTSVVILGNTLEVQHPATLVQWYDCETDLPIPGALGKEYTPTESGYYKAEITSIEGCVVFTDCHYVSTVSTDPDVSNLNWQIQPNPADDFIQITFNGDHFSNAEIVIMDILGKTIIQELKINSPNPVLDVSNFSSGLYLIKITDQYAHSSSKMFSKL